MTRLLAAGFIAALALAGVAFAASTGLTPAQMRAELLAPSTSFYSVTQSGGSKYGAKQAAGALPAASCNGLGKAVNGSYAIFSCALTLHSQASGQTTQSTQWVRPWSSSAVCMTMISVGACPPAPSGKPLANDPRMCASTSPYPYAYCISHAAKAAADSELRTEHVIGVNYGCLATTAFVYHCVGVGDSHPLTVTFVAGKSAWSTKVSVG